MARRNNIIYTPTEGEKVTSEVLIGKWEVSDVGKEQSNVTRNGHMLTVSNKDLIPVKPAVPPEPPAGSVRFVDNVLWVRHGIMWVRLDDGWQDSGSGSAVSWREIAYRAIPVIPDPDYLIEVKR